jgi:hypothetical protein
VQQSLSFKLRALFLLNPEDAINRTSPLDSDRSGFRIAIETMNKRMDSMEQRISRVEARLDELIRGSILSR